MKKVPTEEARADSTENIDTRLQLPTAADKTKQTEAQSAETASAPLPIPPEVSRTVQRMSTSVSAGHVRLEPAVAPIRTVEQPPPSLAAQAEAGMTLSNSGTGDIELDQQQRALIVQVGRCSSLN